MQRWLLKLAQQWADYDLLAVSWHVTYHFHWKWNAILLLKCKLTVTYFWHACLAAWYSQKLHLSWSPSTHVQSKLLSHIPFILGNQLASHQALYNYIDEKSRSFWVFIFCHFMHLLDCFLSHRIGNDGVSKVL